jgi:5'-methylthioinosine phosphorylase
MIALGIIGGTGLTELAGLEIVRREMLPTQYGTPSGPLTFGRLHGREVVFLARHGHDHSIPPHRVNYRANLAALRAAGVTRVLAVAAVGGISDELRPGRLAFPHQVIDYTWGRAHTLYDEPGATVAHVDFTEPYDGALRAQLIAAAAAAGLDAVDHGVYGAAQGPRLESAAEIERMARDGCTMVGMTGMPEAGLARELALAYACCAVVANRAAGRGGAGIHAEIEQHLRGGMLRVKQLLERLLPAL